MLKMRVWNIYLLRRVGCMQQNTEYLMAIMNGKWILRIEWIKACMEAKCLVDEESYEIIHDIHGFFDGPKFGRTRIIDKAPPLFSGLSFYFCGHFVPSYKGCLEDLISVAGGMILKENESLNYVSRSLVSTSFVIYYTDPPQECDLVDQANAIKTRREETDAFASVSGSQVVAHTFRSLPNFSGLDALETIDLHNNSLNGEIPEFLANLLELKYLNLAYNNFNSIPTSLVNNPKKKLN